jgi:hypothetical protein
MRIQTEETKYLYEKEFCKRLNCYHRFIIDRKNLTNHTFYVCAFFKEET